MNYYVNTIYASVQGEGSLVGTPMVVLRLQGCDVGCPFCDTKETWKIQDSDLGTFDDARTNPHKWTVVSGVDVASYIKETWPNHKWVLLTGGEPAQYALAELVGTLHGQGYRVAIETSGTASGHVGVGVDHVCVSPKENYTGKTPIVAAAIHSADDLKFIVTTQKSIAAIVKFLDGYYPPGHPRPAIFLQPVSQSEAATRVAIDAAIAHNWRVSFQIHKYVGLP